MAYRQDLHDLIAPAVEAAGYQLLGLEYLAQGAHSLLRVYIDHPDGIKIDDCETASKQISALLDVEDPINNEYSLEVSSPGIERPLFTAEHFQQALNKEAKINLASPVNGQRKFRGIIAGVEDGTVILNYDNETINLPIAEIAKAHLIANFD